MRRCHPRTARPSGDQPRRPSQRRSPTRLTLSREVPLGPPVVHTAHPSGDGRATRQALAARSRSLSPRSPDARSTARRGAGGAPLPSLPAGPLDLASPRLRFAGGARFGPSAAPAGPGDSIASPAVAARLRTRRRCLTDSGTTRSHHTRQAREDRWKRRSPRSGRGPTKAVQPMLGRDRHEPQQQPFNSSRPKGQGKTSCNQ